MRGENLWATDLPCPTCGADLVVLDDGIAVLRAECRSCGHGELLDNATDGGSDW